MSIKPTIKAFMNSSNPTQLSSRFMQLIKLTVGGKCLEKVDEKVIYFLLNLAEEGAKLNGRPVDFKFQCNVLTFFDCVVVENPKAREIILEHVPIFVKPSTNLQRISLCFSIIKTLIQFEDGVKAICTRIPFTNHLENIVEAATTGFAEIMYILIKVYCNARGSDGQLIRTIRGIPLFHWKMIEDSLEILTICAQQDHLRKEIPKWMIDAGTRGETTLLLLHTTITLPQLMKLKLEGDDLERYYAIVRSAKQLVSIMMEFPEGEAFVRKNVPKYIKYYTTNYAIYDPMEGPSGESEPGPSCSNTAQEEEEEMENNWEEEYNRLLLQYLEKRNAEQSQEPKNRLIIPGFSHSE